MVAEEILPLVKDGGVFMPFFWAIKWKPLMDDIEKATFCGFHQGGTALFCSFAQGHLHWKEKRHFSSNYKLMAEPFGPLKRQLIRAESFALT